MLINNPEMPPAKAFIFIFISMPSQQLLQSAHWINSEQEQQVCDSYR